MIDEVLKNSNSLWASTQVQDNIGMINMFDPRYLDLIVWQVQENDHPPLASPREWDNVGLVNMSDPMFLNLDLVISQVHDNVGLTNIINSRHLDLTF